MRSSRGCRVLGASSSEAVGMTRLFVLLALITAFVFIPSLEIPAALIGAMGAFVAAARIGRAA